MFFLVKYAKALEEASFRGRAADFLWMLLLGGATLAAAAPLAGVQFLGSSLAFMMVYVWSRRNRHVSLSFLGILTFTAPYLPWVLLALSSLLRSSAAVDVLGMGAGEFGLCGGCGVRFRVPLLSFNPHLPPFLFPPHQATSTTSWRTSTPACPAGGARWRRPPCWRPWWMVSVVAGARGRSWRRRGGDCMLSDGDSVFCF